MGRARERRRAREGVTTYYHAVKARSKPLPFTPYTLYSTPYTLRLTTSKKLLGVKRKVVQAYNLLLFFHKRLI